MYGDLKILTGTSNAPLAQAICEHLGCQLTPALCEKFSDGESRIEISSSVRGDDVFVIQPTCAPVNFNLMQLCLMLGKVFPAVLGGLVPIERRAGLGVLHHGGHQIGHTGKLGLGLLNLSLIQSPSPRD